MKTVIGLLSLLTFSDLPASAATTGPIAVENAWTRETPSLAINAPVYMILINRGREADRLMSASSDTAEKVELHSFRVENKVTKMRPVDTIVVNPNIPVILRPAGLHIMLMGLKHSLEANQTFPLILHFQKAGDIEVEVTVKEVL